MSDFHHYRQLGHNLSHRRRNRGGGESNNMVVPPPPTFWGKICNFLVNLLNGLLIFFFFFFCFSSEFSRILPPHSKFCSATYDLGRHMICYIHNSFKLRSINFDELMVQKRASQILYKN